MAFTETRPQQGEQLIDLSAIRKKGARYPTYHYTRVQGEGYYVTLCGKIIEFRRTEMVFTPYKLCDKCDGYARDAQTS